MKVIFTIPLRIRIMDMISNEGKTSLFRKLLARDLLKKIEFSKDEVKENSIEVKEGTWTWKANVDREFEIDEDEADYLRSLVKALDENNEVDFHVAEIGERLNYGKCDSMAVHSDRDGSRSNKKADSVPKSSRKKLGRNAR